MAAVTSWNFTGADWTAPDAADYRYWRAIYNAVQERLNTVANDALFVQTGQYISDILPGMPAITDRAEGRHAWCRQIASILDTLADWFADPDGRQSWQDFPDTLGFVRERKYISSGYVYTKTGRHSRALSNRTGCHYCTLPPAGSPFSEYAEWLKATKNAIDLMTLYIPRYIPAVITRAVSNWRQEVDGDATIAAAYNTCANNVARNLRVLTTGNPESWTLPTGEPTDTGSGSGGNITGSDRRLQRALTNPHVHYSYTLTTWRGDNEGDAYSVAATSGQIAIDMAAKPWANDYGLEITSTDNGNNTTTYTMARTATTPSPLTINGEWCKPVFYPHREPIGTAWLLMHSDTSVALYDADALPTAVGSLPYPGTYQSPHTQGFTMTNIGTSATGTFTIGNASQIADASTVSSSDTNRDKGACYCFMVLIDYGVSGGFNFR